MIIGFILGWAVGICSGVFSGAIAYGLVIHKKEKKIIDGKAVKEWVEAAERGVNER